MFLLSNHDNFSIVAPFGSKWLSFVCPGAVWVVSSILVMPSLPARQGLLRFGEQGHSMVRGTFGDQRPDQWKGDGPRQSPKNERRRDFR